MATLATAAKAAEELHELSGRLHAELVEGCGDFTRLVALADAVGEKSDVLAGLFHEIDRVLIRLMAGEDEPASAAAPAADERDAEEGGGGEEENGDVVGELRALLRRLAALEERLGNADARAAAGGDEGTEAQDAPAHAAAGNGSERGSGNGRSARADNGTNGAPAYDRLTRAQLYNWAQEAQVRGRSRMSKDELVAALRRAERA